jgi:hypothetical protein
MPRTAVPNQIREPMGCVPSSAQPCPQYRTGAEGIFVISPSAGLRDSFPKITATETDTHLRPYDKKSYADFRPC